MLDIYNIEEEDHGCGYIAREMNSSPVLLNVDVGNFDILKRFIGLIDLDVLKDTLHDFQHAEAVSESRVSGVRIDEVAHLQLLQLSQSLEGWRIDDLPF